MRSKACVNHASRLGQISKFLGIFLNFSFSTFLFRNQIPVEIGYLYLGREKSLCNFQLEMSDSTVLERTLSKSLLAREQIGIRVLTQDLRQFRSAKPDFNSNDYLGLTTDPRLREIFLQKASREPLLMGSTGSRLISGNTRLHIAFESRMESHFGSSGALLCNSGFDGNTMFFGSVPQNGDIIVFDELVHASVRDGIAISRATNLYPFAHNSVDDFEKVLLRVVAEHSEIFDGRATVFVAVESLYSMDGDFSPLVDIVSLTEKLIPASSRHIVVDEAHTTGVCGVEGRGFVSLLGLEKNVHTVLHTFGKGRACSGAIILTSPVVRRYLINYARPFIFSTSLPGSTVVAIDSCFDFRSSSVGEELAQRLQENARYFEDSFRQKLAAIPSSLLRLPHKQKHQGLPADLYSPVYPLLATADNINSLATYLRTFGYGTEAVIHPAVPKGQERLRIVVHATNTRQEIDGYTDRVLAWAHEQMGQEISKARL
jgi:8-amino-7-oxononanoate synthase